MRKISGSNVYRSRAALFLINYIDVLWWDNEILRAVIKPLMANGASQWASNSLRRDLYLLKWKSKNSWAAGRSYDRATELWQCWNVQTRQVSHAVSGRWLANLGTPNFQGLQRWSPFPSYHSSCLQLPLQRTFSCEATGAPLRSCSHLLSWLPEWWSGLIVTWWGCTGPDEGRKKLHLKTVIRIS